MDDKARATLASLEATLSNLRNHAELDPFSNPIVLFAIELIRRIDRREIDFDALECLVRELTVQAFANRATRLGAYLGQTDPMINRAAIIAIIERIAGSADFTNFRAVVERPVFGIVLTAHPTFSMPLSIARSLTELACGRSAAGTALDETSQADRLTGAHGQDHCPPEAITLDVEYAWSLEALGNAHTAIEELNRAIFTSARTRWPERWTELTPRLITIASWVGYDQDGRTDVTSMRSLAVRLADKNAALVRYLTAVARINSGASAQLEAALQPIAVVLDRAAIRVTNQSSLLAEAERDSGKMAEFSRAMIAESAAALVDNRPLLALIETALGCADEPKRLDLMVLHASIAAHGLGLAQVHVRLNASQLHNAIRRRIGLDTEPNDPSNRRSYFNRINDLLEVVQPVAVNFATLISEQASACRLMITIAQIAKFVDKVTPIRFLIAETETGFTLLAALYFARLFGVERQVELSPLFETQEAFERGERVIEEALKSPHYREYLTRLGRLAIQFGYSDSGRFIGQMAATFRIERLRLRLAQLLERHGLNTLEVILFNTHGESIGRGGHPNTLEDRLHYLAPSANRAEFLNRGIRVKEEVSFQGGDGFLPFMTSAAAVAVTAKILNFSFCDDAQSSTDPIYHAPDYAAEFFATVQQEFASLVDDSGYAGLLGLYGTNMLYQSGSRPPARQSEEWSARSAIEHPAQLRAIPNNAVLQQLGFLANTLYGVGRAAAKDPEMFAVMRERSPRFRQALELVATALEVSDLDATRAYAYIFDPALWLTNSGRSRSTTRAKELRELARVSEQIEGHERVARVIRRLQADHLLLLELLQPRDSVRRRRVILLHAMKVAIIQRIALLSTGIPPFSPQLGVTRDDVLARILVLEIPAAVKMLAQIFPTRQVNTGEEENFGEESNYQPEAASSYAVEHRTIFDPLDRLYELVRRVGSALNHEIGAMG
jgi:phosphoenolpyruvate carboxylase